MLNDYFNKLNIYYIYNFVIKSVISWVQWGFDEHNVGFLFGRAGTPEFAEQSTVSAAEQAGPRGRHGAVDGRAVQHADKPAQRDTRSHHGARGSGQQQFTVSPDQHSLKCYKQFLKTIILFILLSWNISIFVIPLFLSIGGPNLICC